MDRRHFFSHAATVATASLVGQAAPTGRADLIDTNVSLGDWPTRRMALTTPAQLTAKLRQHGVTSAWVGTFDGVLHTDLAAVNAHLADRCAGAANRGLLRPFGTVNPTLPDWEEDVRRCQEVHRMPGLRLYPNYHGYSLDSARFGRLLEIAARRHLLVQIALSMEDDRSQNPAFAAAPVPAAPLVELMARFPSARVMLLNSSSRILGPNNPLLARLAAAGVYFEIATLEGVAGIASLVQKLPGLRLTFGSHTPFYYFESALLKLQESDLTTGQLAAVRHAHAEAALTPA
jgi:predicted TIM-barrel fold metal-dependent hydrolase